MSQTPEREIVQAKNGGRCVYLGILAGSAGGPIGMIAGGIIGWFVGYEGTKAVLDTLSPEKKGDKMS